jgi:hypothetical protein
MMSHVYLGRKTNVIECDTEQCTEIDRNSEDSKNTRKTDHVILVERKKKANSYLNNISFKRKKKRLEQYSRRIAVHRHRFADCDMIWNVFHFK